MRAIPRACLSTSACECAVAQAASLTRRGSWGVPKKVLNKTELAYDGEARMREFEAFLRSVGGTQTLCASSTSFVRAGHVARADICDADAATFQTEAEFYKMFDHSNYERLRKLYKAEVFPVIYDKVKLRR